MIVWDDLKDQTTLISEDEMKVVETLSQLHKNRVRSGVTQKELAKRIGMQQPQLAKIERMDSMPTLVTLNRYARGLGMEIKMSLVSAH
ncbi:helix-turn-helix domain-containing protein [Companilactobacillus keshanensis]|uniref:Helix-turn-helix domain-containing protein n=1 Tax=Companilactobacillus keshanensis TaxID=2486003 RepID=A0ABW4BU47_9LACO|nr:helix-turn-helix transcriptional regulator [Companilactobacillus keshanensis]